MLIYVIQSGPFITWKVGVRAAFTPRFAYPPDTHSSRLHFSLLTPVVVDSRLHFSLLTPVVVDSRLHFSLLTPVVVDSRLHFSLLTPVVVDSRLHFSLLTPVVVELVGNLSRHHVVVICLRLASVTLLMMPSLLRYVVR